MLITFSLFPGICSQSTGCHTQPTLARPWRVERILDSCKAVFGKSEQIGLLIGNSKVHFNVECTTSHQFATRKIVSDNSLPLILDLYSDNKEIKYFF